MGREVRRVPLDFDWPRNQVWQGYLLPDRLHEQKCQRCDGSGFSDEASQLHSQWYGYTPFDPTDTGSERLTISTPGVRAFAERNVRRSPEFYGAGEAVIRQEARRLADMWNGQWCHHLAQEDVDALIEADRLMDFTHKLTKGEGWVKRDPVPTVTAAEVNAWSLQGFGHDAINCGVVIRARCERDGAPYVCATCEGHGSVETYPGQRAEAEAWEPSEPPAGEGWQMWETTSEGSPVSPVFDTPEPLAAWLADTGASVFGAQTAPYDYWLSVIRGDEFAHVEYGNPGTGERIVLL